MISMPSTTIFQKPAGVAVSSSASVSGASVCTGWSGKLRRIISANGRIVVPISSAMRQP